MNTLPLELWDLIFGHQILQDYAKVLCFVNKRVNKICSKYVDKKINVMNIAAEDGYLELIKWTRNMYPHWNSKTFACAAKGGHLDVLKWLRENGCPCDSTTYFHAARNGHLEVLKWVRENGCKLVRAGTCAFAARGGHLEVLKWARENGCSWGKVTCEYAAKGGHTNILKYLRDNNCPGIEEYLHVLN